MVVAKMPKIIMRLSASRFRLRIFGVGLVDVAVPFTPDCARGLFHKGSPAVPAF